jgi:hypothetical protein
LAASFYVTVKTIAEGNFKQPGAIAIDGNALSSSAIQAIMR